MAQSGAQSGGQPREVLLGTIETREARGGRPQSGREADRGQVAARLLADALTALESGEVMLGRQRLEVLVERFPDTLAGATGRRELEQLFGSRRNAQGEFVEGRPAWLPARRDEAALAGTYIQSRTDGRPAAQALEVQPPPGRRQRLQDERRLQVLAREFQATAGDRVFFGDSEVDLGARARSVLVAQARWLAANPEVAITIEAHADDRGPPAFNLQLAERRGAAVRDRLIAEGVAAERIALRVHGRDRPVATCAASECAAQNRRVVTIVGEAPQAEAGVARRDGRD